MVSPMLGTTAAATPLAGREGAKWGLCLVALAATMAALFADGAWHAMSWWATPEYSHSYVVLGLSLWIVWQRRHAVLAERRVGSWMGPALVAFALVVHLAGTAAFMQRLPYVGLLIALAGLGVAGLGWRAMRRLWLPLFLLLFTLQLPGSLYVFLSVELQLISSWIGARLLDLMGIVVYLDGNIIDLGAMKMQVAEACSGLRYLFPLSAFGFICAWLYRGPWWARVVVLAATVPITILTNSIRIAMTGVFLEWGSVALAEGFMHLFEGWVVFLLALACLVAVMWLLSLVRGRPQTPPRLLDFDRIEGAPAGAATGDRAVGGPLIAALGLMLAVLAGQGQLLEREQYVPARPSLLGFPLQLGDWRGMPRPVAAETLAALGTDDHLLADFRPANGGAPVNLWIAYYGSQVGEAAIHSPKDCLPAGGWEYVSIDPIEAPVLGRDGRPFAINRAVIAQGLERRVMYYWLDMRGRKLTNEFYLKFLNLYDSIVQRRSDGALIRLVTAVRPGETVAAADARLGAFLRLAYPHLEPHVGR
jgi:exosortase D (VPLPA-CTERM-specific)